VTLSEEEEKKHDDDNNNNNNNNTAVPLTATAMSFRYSADLKTRDNKGLEKNTDGTCTIRALRQTMLTNRSKR
jgi:hypothetical protein